MQTKATTPRLATILQSCSQKGYTNQPLDWTPAIIHPVQHETSGQGLEALSHPKDLAEYCPTEMDGGLASLVYMLGVDSNPRSQSWNWWYKWASKAALSRYLPMVRQLPILQQPLLDIWTKQPLKPTCIINFRTGCGDCCPLPACIPNLLSLHPSQLTVFCKIFWDGSELQDLDHLFHAAQDGLWLVFSLGLIGITFWETRMQD